MNGWKKKTIEKIDSMTPVNRNRDNTVDKSFVRLKKKYKTPSDKNMSRPKFGLRIAWILLVEEKTKDKATATIKTVIGRSRDLGFQVIFFEYSRWNPETRNKNKAVNDNKYSLFVTKNSLVVVRKNKGNRNKKVFKIKYLVFVKNFSIRKNYSNF